MRNRLLEEIRCWVIANYRARVTTITGLWGLRCVFKPTMDERKFAYRILVAQTEGQGACYYDAPEVPLECLIRLVGEPYNLQPMGNPSLDIALLDSVAATFLCSADESHELKGPASAKTLSRARLIASEIRDIAHVIAPNRRAVVCNIGVVSMLVRELLDMGFVVAASDMDPSLRGRVLFNQVTVEDGSKTLELVRHSDVAIVTGMALATNTFHDILETAAASGTRVVVFAQTGANFAPFYIQKGVTAVISEPFPFYIFDGNTRINIFRSRVP